ncbi:MAG TPA: TlpA family protein disulfide reductase [Myxococcales bacterium]|nr:TlpA family protein disulfide reductase [Myxococcales bacterium]
MASIQARSPFVRLTEEMTQSGKFEPIEGQWKDEWGLSALEVAPWDSAERLSRLDVDKDLLIVNLWATWCEPCRAELPSMLKLARQMNNGHTWFVFVSYDESWEAPRSMLRRVLKSMPPNVIMLRDPNGQAGGEQSANSIWARMGATGIPETFFVQKGAIHGKIVGAINWDQRVVRGYLRALAGQ